PQELRPGAGDWTRGDLVEGPEKVAVTAARVADEVVCARMHLLEKRRFRIDETVAAERPLDLADDLIGMEYMLENRLNQHSVDALAGKGDLMCVGDELG